MKKFLVLYRANVPASEMMANSTPEHLRTPGGAAVEVIEFLPPSGM